MSLDREFIRFRFESFAANLELHEPGSQGLFKCPFCFDYFDESYLTWKVGSNAIIDAHIIPKSLMNAGSTLCCINCDSKFGGTLTTCERRRHIFRKLKWSNKTAICRTELPTSDGLVNVRTELRWAADGSPLPTFGLDGAECALTSEQLREMWRSFYTVDENGIADDFVLWKPFLYDMKERQADLSWWHSMYLFLFHHFGYSWLGDPRALQIREQLLHPEKEVLPAQFITPRVCVENAPPEDSPLNVRPTLRFGFDSCGKIIESGYFVIFPKLHQTMNNVTLFLPWEFDSELARPHPASFSSRLRYGHSVIRHRIPDSITPDDLVKYAGELV